MALLETLQWLPTWAARIQFSQFSRSVMSDSATPWTSALQASLSITSSWSFISIQLVMPSNHLILCCPLLLLPSIFPSIRSFPKSQFFFRWPKYCSPWNSPGQNTGVGSPSLLQEIFPAQVFNPGLWHCRQILYQLSHKGSLRILAWVAYPSSSRSSHPRNQTKVSCIAG